MILRAYTQGDRRIHTQHGDDGTLIEATLLTNPQKGFRRRLNATQSDETLQAWLRGGEWTSDWEKRL